MTRLIELLAGAWTGEERLSPAPWDPAGGLARTRVENREALGGGALLHEYEQTRGGAVSMRGIGVFRESAEGIAFWWLDTLNPEPRDFRGDLHDGVLTLVSRAARGHTRLVFHFPAPGAYTYRVEASPDGERWSTYLEGDFRREQG